MSEQFESIKKGLEQLIAFEQGDTSVKCRVRYVKIPNIEPVPEYSKEKIKELRQKNNFTQKTFADVLGVTKKSIEKWEAGERKPTGSAKRLFQLIEKDPNVISSMIR